MFRPAAREFTLSPYPAAPATPAPIWVRVFSALSFAAGAVGAVWFPKFGVTGMSREDLLSLRRGTRRRSLRS